MTAGTDGGVFAARAVCGVSGQAKRQSELRLKHSFELFLELANASSGLLVVRSIFLLTLIYRRIRRQGESDNNGVRIGQGEEQVGQVCKWFSGGWGDFVRSNVSGDRTWAAGSALRYV